MLIDTVKIRIKSGDGGKGCESFFRRTDKKIVPNGGDGGDGGDVIFLADRNESSLQFFTYRPFFEAAKGDGGSSNQKAGRKADSIILKVPCGTSIYKAEGMFLIRDLLQDGDKVTAAKGGHGGAGNDRVRLAGSGKPGEELEVILSYTMAADIFLIGTPNSGKSALLRAITGSKVKSETYPFSTKAPQLGAYETYKYDRLTLCELPSLERGSSENKGLGNRFLKHLRRAKLIFFVLDPVSEFAADLQEEKNILENELNAFDPSFASIPRFYVVNKSDLEDQIKKVKKKIFGTYTFFVSSESGDGVANLMKQADRFISEQKKSKDRFEA